MTIFALASGAGRAAIAVLRLSGARTRTILTNLCTTLPEPRRGSLRRLTHHGETLDQALILWFPAPHSYTGEDAAELHLHGGRAVLEAVTQALVDCGARPADSGEFSRRAFLNGRMDLLQAEAVADLVAAETEAQRRQALRQLDGSLGTLYQQWSADLRRILAWQEAQIDFAADELPDDIDRTVLLDIAALSTAMKSHLRDGIRGERLRDGLVFAISGPPNVGKSSLLNALAQEDAAIVSPSPGTTRDAIKVRLELDGIPVTVVDTAGIRESGDEIEQEGIRRALRQRETADLVIELREPGAPLPEGGLAVLNKIDLLPSPRDPGNGWLAISVATGEGLPALRSRLEQEATRLAGLTATATMTRARHRAAIKQAHAALTGSLAARYIDERAEELRLAMSSLARITGEVGVEDLLDSIFATFCIGK